MSDSITESRTGAKGRYVLANNGVESELTYSVQGARMLIDHTYTPPALRGQGVAGQLVERAVADARTRGWSVVPVCPYVKAKIDRTPALQDALDPDWR